MARLTPKSEEMAGRPSLFGLAPGGACLAIPVTRNAVGSYPTLSPLPRTSPGRFAFCGAIPRLPGFPVHRADVIRRLAIVEPGLSSKELPPPRPPGHLIDTP